MSTGRSAFDSILGVVGETKPVPDERWVSRVRDCLDEQEGVRSAYLAFVPVGGEPSEALFIQLVSTPPDAEWVRSLHDSLNASGVLPAALHRAGEDAGGSAGFAIHFFPARELGVVKQAGVLLWEREPS